MKSKLFGAACLLAGATLPAAADTIYLEGGVMTYDAFEASVPHEDLETCPENYDPDQVFCRLTVAGGALNIFVFSYDGDQPLLAIQRVLPDIATGASEGSEGGAPAPAPSFNDGD